MFIEICEERNYIHTNNSMLTGDENRAGAPNCMTYFNPYNVLIYKGKTLKLGEKKGIYVGRKGLCNKSELQL